MDYEAAGWAKIQLLFERAELPEDTEAELEEGTYTNAEIVAKMDMYPLVMSIMLEEIVCFPVIERRRILSEAVDNHLEKMKGESRGTHG